MIAADGRTSESIPIDVDSRNLAYYTAELRDERFVVYDSEGLVIVLDTDEKRTVEFSVLRRSGPQVFGQERRLSYMGDLLVDQPSDAPEYHTFQITQTEQGLEYIYRDPEQTREYIDSTYRGRGEFWFDGEYLMYGERLVTANARTFDRYFKNRPGYDDAGGITTTSDTSFLGMDNDGNYYWVNPLFLAVYTPTGRLLHAMRFNMVPEMGRPQIDPQGNIYILSYGGVTPGQLDLLWIERDW